MVFNKTELESKTNSSVPYKNQLRRILFTFLSKQIIKREATSTLTMKNILHFNECFKYISNSFENYQLSNGRMNSFLHFFMLLFFKYTERYIYLKNKISWESTQVSNALSQLTNALILYRSVSQLVTFSGLFTKKTEA